MSITCLICLLQFHRVTWQRRAIVLASSRASVAVVTHWSTATRRTTTGTRATRVTSWAVVPSSCSSRSPTSSAQWGLLLQLLLLQCYSVQMLAQRTCILVLFAQVQVDLLVIKLKNSLWNLATLAAGCCCGTVMDGRIATTSRCPPINTTGVWWLIRHAKPAGHLTYSLLL